MHVIVDAVRSTVAGIVAPGRGKEECRVRRIVGAVGAGGIRPSQERIVQHPVARIIGNSQRAVIWRNRYAVGKTTGGDDTPENPILGILIDCTGPIRRIGSGPCSPWIGEIQVALGVKVEIIRTLEEFVMERRNE